MLTEKIVLTGSIKAAAALATKHRFVNFAGNYCGANAKAAGVLAQPTLSGDMAPINIIGLTIVEAGGAITAGKRVASDASGRAVQATALGATVAGTGAIPEGATPVTSTSASPEVALTATSTLAGGEPPQPTNGVAWTAAAEAGDLILVLING
ncbi:MAG TPA: capsid cement protein [Candidatus Limnocylindrales bacterium]|nr:capsid cement protein [Candidatus Limnocylindrales bacterium]